MTAENFSKLKEIDSLNRTRIRHLSTIEEQESRLVKLNLRKEENERLTNLLRQENISLQQKLHELEKRLKTASEQKQRLIDLGGEDEKIASFQQQINAAEEEGLDYLEQLEKNEKDLGEANTFREGLNKTYSEIETEVITAVAHEKKEIENIDFRINLLQEELPSNIRQLLERTMKKNLAHGPFTRIEAGSCYFCRFKISRIEESEIDMQKMVKTCPQCSRIFLPYGT